MSEQSHDDRMVRWRTRLWRYLDAALYRLMSQRVTLTLLVIAAAEALVAPFAGVKWAIFSLATSAIAGGLLLAAACLWLSALLDDDQQL